MTATLRKAIEAELVLEDNDLARGINRGLQTALKHVDAYDARITSALDARKAEGKKTGGNSPYGYTAAPDGTLSECAEEQAVIDVVQRLRLDQQLSLRAVVKELWDRRMRPRKRPDGTRPRRFDPTQIRRIAARLLEQRDTAILKGHD